MKFYSLIVLFVFCVLFGHAQNYAPNQLAGYWQLVGGYNRDSSYVLDTSNYKQYFWLDGGGKLSEYTTSIAVKTNEQQGDTAVNMQGGTWSIDKKNPYLHFHHTSSQNKKTGRYNYAREQTDTIISFDGTILKLKTYETMEMHYKKVAAIPVFDVEKVNEKTLEDSLPYKPLYIYRKKQSKKFELKPNSNIRISICDYDSTCYCNNCPEEYTGSFISYKNNSLRMNVNTKEITLTDSNYQTMEEYNYSEYYTENIRSFKLDTITYLYYSSPKRIWMNKASIGFMSIAALNMLVVAPLVSINYKEGTLNSKRYLSWAGWSAVGLAASFTINLSTGMRQYKIAPAF